MEKFWLQFPSAIRSVPREDFYRGHCKELTSYLLPGNRSPQLTGFTVVTLDGTFANGQWQVLDGVSGHGGLWRIGDEGKGSVTGCKSQHIYSKHIPTLYKIPKPSTIGKLHEKNPGDHE